MTAVSVGSPRAAAARWPRVRLRLAAPLTLFLIFNLIAGGLLVAVAPPLRGPDEARHFLRAWGIATGEVVPRLTDDQGRKGITLPAWLHRDLTFFDDARYSTRGPGFTYRDIFANYARQQATPPASDPDAPVFILYNGSEGYSPIPYLPYVAAIFVARAADLGFLPMLYLMRVFGLIATTAVAAYAIAVVPRLAWTFLLIGLLPSALYSRAVLSADGASLACAMAAVALTLRATLTPAPGRPWERSLWLTLGALSKPPQLALVLIEAMRHPLRRWPRHWRSAVIVTLPAIVLAFAWAVAGAADVAAYRLIEGMGVPAHQFDPLWKLDHMLREPLHFPRLLLHSFTDYGGQMWRQLIGVLGWLDTPLAAWTYPVLTLLLLASFFTSLGADRATGRRIAAVSALAAIGYGLSVFLIFFLVWTTLDATQIDGVQGRYFVAALPAAALVPAALLRRGLSERMQMTIALAAAVMSCAAAVAAVLQADWNF